MTDVEIITNNVPRDVQDDWNQEGEFNNAYVMYKGERYDLDDFQTTQMAGNPGSKLFKDWDGYISDTFFSGILLKWVPGTNWEQVIMGRYYAH